MTDLIVIVPTRERPEAVEKMLRAFSETCRGDTILAFAIDGEDCNADYRETCTRLESRFPQQRWMVLYGGERLRMIGTLNQAASRIISGLQPYAIAYMGDDHRPRTPGWDVLYVNALRDLGTGIVYGDDGHQGENLPTQMAMTADIPQALGYVVPPLLNHMYCDNFWLDLGRGADCITYLPNVRVTHVHPAIHPDGKWDASYQQSNSVGSYDRDKAAYEQFVSSGALAADIEKIRILRAETGGPT
jgi:hypothetical protein